jgi:hypothetical protein
MISVGRPCQLLEQTAETFSGASYLVSGTVAIAPRETPISVSDAWPNTLDFLGAPLLIEPSPGQLSSHISLLGVAACHSVSVRRIACLRPWRNPCRMRVQALPRAESGTRGWKKNGAHDR